MPKPLSPPCMTSFTNAHKVNYQNCFLGLFIQILCDSIRRFSQFLFQRSDRKLGSKLGRRVTRVTFFLARTKNGTLLGQDLTPWEQAHVEVVNVGDQQVRILCLDLKQKQTRLVNTGFKDFNVLNFFQAAPTDKKWLSKIVSLLKNQGSIDRVRLKTPINNFS